MAEKYDAFYPGQVWYDTEGKRIQAHGGSVMYLEEDGLRGGYLAPGRLGLLLLGSRQLEGRGDHHRAQARRSGVLPPSEKVHGPSPYHLQ